MNDQGTSTARRILIVDDNPAIHDDFRKILSPKSSEASEDLDRAEAELFGEATAQRPRAAPFALASAHQGKDGLELAEKAMAAGAPFAMAFVDMRMPPGWDGIQTIDALWKAQPDLEVVLCTAHSDRSWDEILETLGTSHRLLILKKPFDPVEALQLAFALTEKWSLARRVERHVVDLEDNVRLRTAELREANERLLKEIADRNRMELELRRAQRLETVGRLAAGIAHEINTPIQFVGDSVQYLKQAFEDMTGLIRRYRELLAEAPERRAAADEAERAADLEYLEAQAPKAFGRSLEGLARIAEIVRAMKDFAQRDPGRTEPTDLNAAVSATLSVARHETKYVAEVTADLQPLPPVVCNPAEIKEALLGVVINAAQAVAEAVGGGGDKGAIAVRTRREGDEAVIAVSDTGRGVPESIREKIFDPFFTTKPVGKGMGQGLAIAHNTVVDKHGGSLSFETAEGRGTTFTIRLPIAGRAARKEAA